MQGFQLTFFTQQDRRHGHTPLSDWLLDLARECGLHGATVIAASKGFGHTGKMHSADFFDLADQPQMVVMTATHEQVETILSRIQEEKLQISCIRTPAEFDLLGG